MSLFAGVVANIDHSRIVGFALLGALLAAVLVRGVRPSGVRRAAVTWSIVAVTVEALIAVLGMGMATTIGFTIVILSAAPTAWRKVTASRVPMQPGAPHRRSAAWSDQGLTRPCLGE